MTKHKHYYAIRAYADGWTIELKEYEHWVVVTHPGFVENREHRVVPDENGWLPWYGGECPVDPDTMVEVRVGYCVGKSRKAGDYNTTWGSNITAYRVIKEVDPYAKLKAAAKDSTKQIRYVCDWRDSGCDWEFNRPVDKYEVRNKPQKMQLLAWVNPIYGSIAWGNEMPPDWKRVPSEDKEVEVEE
jgi:hypothetical protein